jgi:hypothetical protein
VSGRGGGGLGFPSKTSPLGGANSSPNANANAHAVGDACRLSWASIPSPFRSPSFFPSISQSSRTALAHAGIISSSLPGSPLLLTHLALLPFAAFECFCCCSSLASMPSSRRRAGSCSVSSSSSEFSPCHYPAVLLGLSGAD